MQRWVHGLTAMALLAVLLIATVGWRGGGGFGGGRSSGGFSSRSSGGFSSRRSGGFGGSRSYGGYRGPIIIGGYGFGPRMHGGSGTGTLIAILVIGGVVGLVFAGMAVSQWMASRAALITMGVNLRRGSRYTRKLDDLIENANFADGSGRATALHRLANLIETDDVVDGYVTVLDRRGGAEQLGERADTLARAQMQRVGITPDIVNVSDITGATIQMDTRAGTGSPSDACVVGIVAVARANTIREIVSGGEADVLKALRVLHETRGRDIGAVYVFYKPNRGEPLDAVAANRLFLDLKATATSPA